MSILLVKYQINIYHIYNKNDKINLINHMEQISLLRKDFICNRE